MANIWALPLALSNFNIAVAVLGGFISLFGLVSYLLKEQLYLSETLISLLFGVALGPSGANFIRPEAYISSCASPSTQPDCQDSLDAVTLALSRLVLGVQLVIAGIQLPSKYLWRERRSLALLLGPGMTCMWLATSLLVWALVSPPSLLHALAVGACVTPTDPVLSAVIIRGRFADDNVPRPLQDLIVAESGANDGLGYPFLFFALYLIKYRGFGGAGDAVGLWFALTWAYTIALSVVYGALVGWLAKELLRRARARGLVDRESFLVFALSLALFVLGTSGLVGTDDILACFVAGNAFTWDDWFRKETEDDSLQAVVDMLLNVFVFMWYGVVIPWDLFRHNAVVSLGRLVALGVAVLLLRRLPWIFGLHGWIHQIHGTRQALFVGFFGPIGVSAVFYLLVTVDFIQQHLSSDEAGRVPRRDVQHLGETVRVIVWFLTLCSTVVHGLSIPIGTVGYFTSRTIGRLMGASPSGSGTSVFLGFRLGARLPTVSRWLSFGESDIETAAGASPSLPSGLPAQGPHPPAGAVLPGNQGEPASELQDSMSPRRREIRFYEDQEPRPFRP